MKKQVEVWHLIIYGAIFIGSVMTIIINQSTRIVKDEESILYLQKFQDKTDSYQEKTDQNFREVNQNLTKILVELQNKKDRDK